MTIMGGGQKNSAVHNYIVFNMCEVYASVRYHIYMRIESPRPISRQRGWVHIASALICRNVYFFVAYRFTSDASQPPPC